MAKTFIKITDEQIAAKRESFLNDIAKKSELAKNGRSSPAKLFLEKIKDVVKIAIDSGLSYKEIAKSIYAQWNVHISEGTLRSFAQNTMGIKKEQRVQKEVSSNQPAGVKSTDVKPIESKTIIPVVEPKNGTPSDGVKQAPANFDDV